MTSVFTKLIEGEGDRDAAFIYKDSEAVAFMTFRPITPGHTLVVPREETDHWLDCPPETLTRCMQIARMVGHAIQKTYQPKKVGLMLAGMEVPHMHIHVLPIWGLDDLEFARAARVSDEEQHLQAAKIRENL